MQLSKECSFDDVVPPRFSREPGVPDYRVSRLAGKTADFVVLVPVVNEGDRIRTQLLQMAKRTFAVDVVIVDGGSTDGSLSPDLLEQARVTAVISCEAGLSRQLRAGFSFALDGGYMGAITIDGNGKDSWWDIPKFIEALRAGAGFVQGSRYLAGGAAINTPRDRAFAVKWIHAPLISLAARRRYSDTTNGFRGYLTSMLYDPEVAVFRDIFVKYNLLFYLSIRAPRLGYRVAEVPVQRQYPASGKVPTKISGIRGKLLVLRELFGAVAGAYNP